MDKPSKVDRPTPCKVCGTTEGSYVKRADGMGTICIPCLEELRKLWEHEEEQLRRMFP